jgi:LemA protein
MKKTLITISIIVTAILMFWGLCASANNYAISLEEQVLSADSDIQTQEKRRSDLIYNLADCVMQYDKHEAETLLDIVEARNGNTSNINAQDIQTSISAVAEAYPELKSSDNYKELMNELSITENMIAQYRTSYNSQVRSYNKFVRKFPNKQFLAIMGYEAIEYKYLEYSEDDRQAVSNLFGE